VVTIISILAAILFINFNDARAFARDEVRKNTLREMQIALKLYESQFGEYPEAGCEASGWVGPGPQPGPSGAQECQVYIKGLAPDFISALPLDPVWEDEIGRGYVYQVNGDQSAYKLMSYKTVEADFVTDYNHDFSRCPSNLGGNCGITPNTDTYAVYSFGAEDM